MLGTSNWNFYNSNVNIKEYRSDYLEYFFFCYSGYVNNKIISPNIENISCITCSRIITIFEQHDLRLN